MEKPEFLKLFAECIDSGDIEIRVSVETDDCFGTRVRTQVFVQEKRCVEIIGDFTYFKTY